MNATSTPTNARPSAIAIDAKWLTRFGRRYIGWHRSFPQTLGRNNRRVALKVATINYSHFKDHGGPNLESCDRTGSDGRVLAIKEREFRRRATPAVILDMLDEIEALHAAVFDLDPRFCWEKSWRKFVNRLRRHPEEVGESERMYELPAATAQTATTD